MKLNNLTFACLALLFSSLAYSSETRNHETQESEEAKFVRILRVAYGFTENPLGIHRKTCRIQQETQEHEEAKFAQAIRSAYGFNVEGPLSLPLPHRQPSQ